MRENERLRITKKKIDDGEIKDGTRIKDNHGDEYIYHDGSGNLLKVEQLLGDDEESMCLYKFTPYQLYRNKFEIIEEPILTDKEYEDIEEIKIDYDDGDIALDGVYLTSNHSEILANKINTLIRNQKYILEEIKKLKED